MVSTWLFVHRTTTVIVCVKHLLYCSSHTFLSKYTGREQSVAEDVKVGLGPVPIAWECIIAWSLGWLVISPHAWFNSARQNDRRDSKNHRQFTGMLGCCRILFSTGGQDISLLFSQRWDHQRICDSVCIPTAQSWIQSWQASFCFKEDHYLRPRSC